ncbi:unnamed protein product [Adineta ricciae]|uniref:SET domain-containing protein n=1 Tax=Adineta ricciae TaxID=249248 RepID=A0A814BA57_ADIRI|nr:unnamed protein product [Adineta ricciae]
MSVDSDYEKFFDWIREKGGRIHKHIKIDTREERGLFATSTIESHAALAIIPWSLVVNKQHVDLATIDADTERQALVLFLSREYMKQEESNWYPWIKLLNIDKEADELLKIKMNLFNCVEHSTLGQALTARYQQLEQEYEYLNQSDMIHISFELFCAIDHLVWSRILDLPENEPISLVPFIDFANHNFNASARWFIDDTTHDLILRSEQSLNPGEEITICYGSKSNEELLYLYGFCQPVNLNDRVTLPVSLSPDDLLLEDKLRLVKELHLPPRLNFDIDGHLTNDSQRLVKVLSAQTLTTIDHVSEHCKPYLQNLLNEYLENLNLCTDEEMFTKYYLDSQKSIVQKALNDLE